MADHLRRPLYTAEKVAVPATVCVTGASGYVAAPIIARLLAAGHTVHGTVPDLCAQHTYAHLKELPGAERLKIFGARLHHPGTFDHAVNSCDYVIHTASAVGYLTGSIEDGQALIDAEVEGMKNVLSAVEQAGTVKKVVLTSSAAAVSGDPSIRCTGHRYTEADWDLSASSMHLPTHRAKSQAELQAYQMSRGKPWKICSICPTFIQGPPLGKIKCESTNFMQRVLNGDTWCLPRLGMGIVDVDDVAAAHTLALFIPHASGRYLVSAMNMDLSQYVKLLRPEYSGFPLPRLCWPRCCTNLALRALGEDEVGFSADVVRALQGRVPFYDSTRSITELGLKHFPVRRTAQDMADALISLGMVKDRRR
eukprot:jgi/Botrbrau1/9540/Bobra.0089s0002.1